jgi:hypothetical protein
VSNLKKRLGLSVVEVVKYTQREDDIEVVAFGEVIPAHPLTHESCLRKAASSCFDILRTDVEADVVH